MQRTLNLSLLAAGTLSAALLFGACGSTPGNEASGEKKDAVAAAAAPDQAAAPRQRYHVVETQIKPGMMDAYQDFTRKETVAAYQKAGVKEFSYYTRANLGEGGWVVSLRPIEDLKHFDEPSLLVKALGEAGAKAFGAKRAQFVVNSRSYIMQSRPELSHLPNPNVPDKLAFVARNSIAPGRTADFENWIKNDTLPIIKKANPKGSFVGRVGLGGDSNEYHTVVLVDSFADYQRYSEALQKEGFDKVAPKAAGIVAHRESAVYRFVPELSIPQPVVAQKK